MKSHSFIIVTTLMLLYVALVFFCCLYNFSGDDTMDLGQYFLGIRLDRYIHFTMFFPYPFVAWLFLNYSKKSIVYKDYTYALIIITGLLLASFAEASQELFTKYRDTDPFDLGANITGILVATLILYILHKPLTALCDYLFK